MSPQGGGQADHWQIQRPQKQGLDGVAVLVDQQPLGNILEVDLPTAVLGRLVRQKDERPQREAGPEGVHRDHCAMEAEMGTVPVPQKDHCPRRCLEQPPGALEQDIEQPFHFMRSRLASSPSGVTWAVS